MASCPGPHQVCQGCGGQKMTLEPKHYQGKHPTHEMPGLATCRSCQGKGQFCEPKLCDGTGEGAEIYGRPPA